MLCTVETRGEAGYQMNIYEKLQQAKVALLEKNLKKSGENKFAKFSYYELSDILPSIIQICDDMKLFTCVNFDEHNATLEIINSEKPDEKIKYTSPMRELDMKGCNEIQALGGVETYSRRYLYMAAFDIVENDMFDCQEKIEKEYKCEKCGKKFSPCTTKDGRKYTAGQIYEMSKKRNGKALCKECVNSIERTENNAK